MLNAKQENHEKLFQILGMTNVYRLKIKRLNQTIIYTTVNTEIFLNEKESFENNLTCSSHNDS